MLRKAEKQEGPFECVARDCWLHIAENCTDLPELALKGIQAVGLNALLLCNEWVKEEQHQRLKMLAKGETERKPTQSFETEVAHLKKSVQEIKSILNEKASSRQLPPPPVKPLVEHQEPKRTAAIEVLNGIRIRGVERGA